MHLTSNPVDWYAARAGGIVAYVLLSLNVTVGVLMTAKKSFSRWPRFALEDVHRYTGILTGTFVVLHIVAVAIDAYLPFSVASLAIPLLSSYRPIWTGLGIAAAELLLALAFTNHYRNTKLPYATWRKIHYVNFVVWTAATFHAVGTGTDRSTPWMLAIYRPRRRRRLRVDRLADPQAAGPGRVDAKGRAHHGWDRERRSRGGTRGRSAAVPAQAVERRRLPGHAERPDPRRHGGDARHRVDGRQRQRIPERARPRRPVGHAEQARVNDFPDGIPAERDPLLRRGDQRTQRILRGHVHDAGWQQPLGQRALDRARLGRVDLERRNHLARLNAVAA